MKYHLLIDFGSSSNINKPNWEYGGSYDTIDNLTKHMNGFGTFRCRVIKGEELECYQEKEIITKEYEVLVNKVKDKDTI
jgi:hypothetical protein